MRTQLKIILLFAISFLFCTCKKEIFYTHIEGIAQDYYTKQAIANATVELDGPIDEASGNGIIKSVITDDNGHFEFEKFKAFKSGTYYVNIEKENYSSYNDDGSADIEKGKRNFLTPFIAATAFIRINISNENPFDENDNICLNFDNPEEKLTDLMKSHIDLNLPFCYQGNQHTMGLGILLSCNTNFTLNWSVTKNNSISNYSSQLNLRPECKDTIFNIIY